MINTSRLIELVQINPILYDTTHKDYKNSATKELIWNEIAEILGVTTLRARAKWRNLRDTYFRHLRCMVLGKPTKKKWIWFDQIYAFQPNSQRVDYSVQSEEDFRADICEETIYDQEFGDNDVEEIQDHFGNEDHKPSAEDNDEFNDPLGNNKINLETLEIGTAKKRKHDIDHEKPKIDNKRLSIDETYDATDLLFLAHAKVVKTFSGKQQAVTKLKIAQVIMEQELLHHEELEKISLS